MSRQEVLNRLINNMASDLEGFMGASVVDVETGMSLASVSRINDFDLDVASAYNSEMVKAKLKTIRALNLQVNLVDMLLTLENQLHLVRLLDSQLFLYVAGSSDNCNLALLRSTVARRVAELG